MDHLSCGSCTSVAQGMGAPAPAWLVMVRTALAQPEGMAGVGTGLGGAESPWATA